MQPDLWSAAMQPFHSPSSVALSTHRLLIEIGIEKFLVRIVLLLYNQTKFKSKNLGI
jgi:hypothetical protein